MQRLQYLSRLWPPPPRFSTAVKVAVGALEASTSQQVDIDQLDKPYRFFHNCAEITKQEAKNALSVGHQVFAVPIGRKLVSLKSRQTAARFLRILAA